MGAGAKVMSDQQVEEIQGLYGLFTVSEQLVQRIWQDRDFHQDG